MNYEVKDKNILVLGSGGASFGIISELINRKASKIIVSNRTKIRCHQLIENFKNNKTKLDKMEWQKIRAKSRNRFNYQHNLDWNERK